MKSEVKKYKQNDIFKQNTYRLFLLWFLMVVGFGVLMVRVFAEQYFHSTLYQNRVEQQTIRRIRVPANRGAILSSDEMVIAKTRPSYDVVFHLSSFLKRRRKETVQNVMSTYTQIANALVRPIEMTDTDVARHMNMRPGLPLTVLTDLSQYELATLLEMPELPAGVEILATPMRTYPCGRSACHLIGWVGKADPSTQPDSRAYSYYSPDMIGRHALEAVLDSTIELDGKVYRGLRGSAGEKLLLVNTLGYPVRSLQNDEFVEDGNSVQLTLNMQAQELSEELLQGLRGAFVLLDVETGDIVAMASNPGYDLQQCVPRLSNATYQAWRTDTEGPLRDRAAKEIEMPGSIIKPLVALAIMQTFPASVTSHCAGGAQIGNQRIGCTGRHGDVDLVNAIRASCNTYFIERGTGTGIENIQKIFKAAGLGERPKGYILSSSAGVFPSEEVKRKTDGTRWTIFDTALVSIGQGKIAISPLQAALYMSAIANGGKAYEPNLIAKVIAPDGTFLAEKKNHRIAIDLPVTRYQISQVQEGMKRVVETGGTGRRAQNPNATIYGKTGTAEIGSRALGNYRTNTWFAGYAKHKNGKTYAFASFIENGRAGGYTNAPIVAEFFTRWLP